MTIPLTSAVGCGVAAVLCFSAIHLQKTPLPVNTSPRFSNPTWPDNRRLGLTVDGRRAAMPKGKLNKPFTLIYEVTSTDMRTPAMKEYAIRQDRKSLQARLDRDEITKEAMDRALAEDARQDSFTRTNGRLFLASDGSSLIVEGESEGEKPRADCALIRNGHTYIFSPNPKIMPQRFEDIVPFNLSNVPYVGPELPNLPIRKGDKVLYLLAAAPNVAAPDAATGHGSRLAYVTGRILADKDGTVKQVLIGKPGSANTYDLSGHVSFLGEKVASRIVWTRYMFWQGYPDQGKPQSRTEYRLVGCSPMPPSSNFFTPENYVSDGQRVQIVFAGNRSASFEYHKASGAFDAQAEDAKARANN